ncbi:MAG TPA: transglutaminase family protein [Candidatus Sulfotelmatobacter sp.]|nr:transglutaminase family protein [Candidatus Sulfotelmatobacter sp.]
MPAATVRYRIRHSTTCRYSDEIQLAHHLLHLRPRVQPGQRTIGHRMKFAPQPSHVEDHADYFGNPTTYVALQEPHRTLVIESESEIDVAAPAPFDETATPAWEQLREEPRSTAGRAGAQAGRFAYASAHVPLLAALCDYALPSFPPARPIGEAAADLNRRIFNDFTFDPVATTIATPLAQVLGERRGVCQDFAHLAIGCLRAVGVPARYVSGYLRTVPPPGAARLVGADASHAWFSVWGGGDLWLDFDPTNGKAGSTDLVTMAWGRDYHDVSPVRGVLVGGGSQELIVEVDVEPIAAPPV